jgi:Lrp/AsnC family leucine-responsive transcriptional regulator
MNEIDKKILSIIQEQGQISYGELGKEVGLSVSAINERLKKLENKQIIKGWSARVDAKALGLEVLAFVFLQHERPAYEDSFKQEMLKLSEVEECHHITGEWSYLLKIREKNISDLEKFISNKIRSSKGVVRTQTIIALSSPKEWSPHMIR